MAIKAASDLAKRRWSKASKAEREEIGQAMARGRKEKIPTEQRREIARRAAQARWVKKKKGHRQ
jgi:hypothetical protein